MKNTSFRARVINMQRGESITIPVTGWDTPPSGDMPLILDSHTIVNTPLGETGRSAHIPSPGFSKRMSKADAARAELK